MNKIAYRGPLFGSSPYTFQFHHNSTFLSCFSLCYLSYDKLFLLSFLFSFTWFWHKETQKIVWLALKALVCGLIVRSMSCISIASLEFFWLAMHMSCCLLLACFNELFHLIFFVFDFSFVAISPIYLISLYVSYKFPISWWQLT